MCRPELILRPSAQSADFDYYKIHATKKHIDGAIRLGYSVWEYTKFSRFGRDTEYKMKCSIWVPFPSGVLGILCVESEWKIFLTILKDTDKSDNGFELGSIMTRTIRQCLST